MAAVFAAPARSQQPPQPQPAPTVVEAAQQARDREAHSEKRLKVFTNEDFAPLPSSPQAAGGIAASSTAATESSPSPAGTSCQNPGEASALDTELQSAQDERNQLQSDLSAQPPVISDGDLDTHNLDPGRSGLSVGSQPLQESQPEAPARIAEVTLDQKIASLKKSLQVSCDPPEAASVQKKLDALEQELSSAQRALALDQETFYSNPSYITDAAGKARLDAEQQQVDSLQSQKDLLTAQLAAARPGEPSPEQSPQ